MLASRATDLWRAALSSPNFLIGAIIVGHLCRPALLSFVLDAVR
jgi:hypothetical protein